MQKTIFYETNESINNLGLIKQKEDVWDIVFPPFFKDFYSKYNLGSDVIQIIENKYSITPILGLSIEDKSYYEDGFFIIFRFFTPNDFSYNEGRKDMINIGEDNSNSDGLCICVEGEDCGKIFSYVSGPWINKEEEIVIRVADSFESLINRIGLYINDENGTWRQIGFEEGSIIFL